MTYILLAAGSGTRLQPLTLHYPKTLYKLDKNTTILERMIGLIRKYDHDAEIVVVTGFEADLISEHLSDDVIVVNNPFYSVTNSIASLWFASDYLDRENVVIMNGDIVMEESILQNIVCMPVNEPKILLDSSINESGDYNVQVSGRHVLVMSKGLENYYGEYAGVSLLDRSSALHLREVVDKMVSQGMYDQWYENALVSMIFQNDFTLYYEDISQYKWTEVDCVDDMLLAKRIHNI